MCISWEDLKSVLLWKSKPLSMSCVRPGGVIFPLLNTLLQYVSSFSTDFYKLFKNLRVLFESVWTTHCWPFSCLVMCREYICISGGTFNQMHKDSYDLEFVSVYLLKNTPWSQRIKHLISVCVQCAVVIIENVTFKGPRHVSRLMRKCTLRIKYIIIGFFNL